MCASEACYHSELFVCKQQGKRPTFISLCPFGDTLALPVPTALAFGKLEPFSKDNSDDFIPLEGIKLILIPRVVLPVQRLPRCRLTAGLQRSQL